MNKYTKINDILKFSDIHPADHRFILSYILELEKENKDLQQRINNATDRLEALIIFWKKYNPVDNYMQVEQFNGVIDILNGGTNDNVNRIIDHI